jgi:hypothetical protein
MPKTWGEAVENRIGKQNLKYQNNYPSGSYEIGPSKKNAKPTKY